jgi:hypothetical protein
MTLLVNLEMEESLVGTRIGRSNDDLAPGGGHLGPQGCYRGKAAYPIKENSTAGHRKNENDQRLKMAELMSGTIGWHETLTYQATQPASSRKNSVRKSWRQPEISIG